MDGAAGHVRNAILSRWAVLQVLEDAAPMLHTAKQGDVAGAIRQHVLSVTESAWKKGDDRPLADFLRDLYEEITHLYSVKAALKMQPEKIGTVLQLCQSLQAQFEALIRNSNPIERVFVDVLAATSDLYSHFGEHIPSTILEDASISIRYSGESPQNALLAGSASTHFDPNLATRSQIILGISVTQLDSLTINALPYVLFHECVSHVTQGPWAASRREHAEDSQFSEGWMDYISLLVHHAALSESTRWTGFSKNFHPLRRRRHTQAAEQLHNRRITESKDDAWAARAIGADAASWLKELLSSLTFTKAHPEDSLFRLSLRLNSSALEDEDLQLFTQAIHTVLQLESGRTDLEEILVKYSRTGDVLTLVASTVSLAEAAVASGGWATKGQQVVHGPSLLGALLGANRFGALPASLLVARSLLLTRVPSTATLDRRRKLLRLARLAAADAGREHAYLRWRGADLPRRLGVVSAAVRLLLNLAEYEQAHMESRASDSIVHQQEEIQEDLARLSETLQLVDPALLLQVQLRCITSPFGEFLADVVRDLPAAPVASWRPIVLMGDDEIDADSHYPLPVFAEILRKQGIRFQPVVADDWKERGKLAGRLSNIYNDRPASKPVVVFSVRQGGGVEWSSHLRDLSSTHATDIEFVTVGSSEEWGGSLDLSQMKSGRNASGVSFIELHSTSEPQATNQWPSHIKELLGLELNR